MICFIPALSMVYPLSADFYGVMKTISWDVRSAPFNHRTTGIVHGALNARAWRRRADTK